MSFKTEVARVASLISGTFDQVKRDRSGHAHVNVKLPAQALRRRRILDAADGECTGRTALERSLTGYRLALEHELLRMMESRLTKGGWNADLYNLCFAWYSSAPGLRMKFDMIAIIHDRADVILTIKDHEGCSSLVYFHLAIVRDQRDDVLRSNQCSK